MTRLDQLGRFLAKVEESLPLSIFLPLAAQHGFLTPSDWQEWGTDQLKRVERPDRWLTNLVAARSVNDLRNALSERTELISGYWGYYDLLETGMRALAARHGGGETLADVLAESSGSLHHQPVELDEESVIKAISHMRGAENHPSEHAEVVAVCTRLADHTARMFAILGLPLRASVPSGLDMGSG